MRCDALQGRQEPFDPQTRVPVRARGSAALNVRASGATPPTRPIPRLTAVTVPDAAAPPQQEAGPPDADALFEERARDEARLRLRRGRLVTAVVAGVVVVVVGVVALLGGFERRTDLLVPVAVGSVISTGPYEVTLASATLQHRTSGDEWVVVASGTARTTGDTSIDPPSGDAGFVYARSTASGEVQASSSIALGDAADGGSRNSLTPGLPAVPWSVSFRFTASPGDHVLLAVFDQEYTTPYLFSDEEGWRSTSKASTFTLPLEKLPDSEY